MEIYSTEKKPITVTTENKAKLNAAGLNKPIETDLGSTHVIYDLGAQGRYLVLHPKMSWTEIGKKKYSKLMLIGRKVNDHPTEHEIEVVQETELEKVLSAISSGFAIDYRRFQGGINGKDWTRLVKEFEAKGGEI